MFIKQSFVVDRSIDQVLSSIAHTDIDQLGDRSSLSFEDAGGGTRITILHPGGDLPEDIRHVTALVDALHKHLKIDQVAVHTMVL
ncbi:MAG: hypothetical protein JXJ17_00910 [Anaerolineae bacterium]|nr:hypothetical protein [Anaerolineae bacterium]